MSLVDSAAAFERKCKDAKNGEDLFNGLKALGVTDFNTLAFTLGTPQKPPTEDQVADLGAKVFGVPTVGQLSSLRRLHFEATTLVVASLNEQVKSDTDPNFSKKLPAAEKQSRLETQQKRLVGLKISGELSPSHQLLDAANAMVESGVISWISPSKCPKRDDEVQSNLKNTSSTTTFQVEQSTLKFAQVPVVTATDVGTELKLQWALQRRGIAFDQCRLLDWSIHEDWVQWLLQCLTRDVPSGFTTVKTEQLIRADKELWTILAQANPKTLKPENDVPALNTAFKALTTDPRVTMFVLPLPGGSTKPGANANKTPNPKTASSPKQPNKRRKTTRAEKACPEELKKYTLKLEGKGNICWGYNLASGCPHTTSGQPPRCQKGFHVCANCHKPGHSLSTCRSKS